MKRIVVIDAHPHSDPGHFVHALATAYVNGADGRHEVRRINVADIDFPILRDPQDWLHGELPPSLQRAKEAIDWAEHLVILYPLWLGDIPALLKAFLEQVARPGFAIEQGDHGLFRKLLKGRSARIVVTMGMPAGIYRLFFRAHSLKSLKRNILHFVGISPVRTTVIGGVAGDRKYTEKWIGRLERMGRAGN